MAHPDPSRTKSQSSSAKSNDIRRIRIISGGQTGVDRAALDAAIKLGFEHGGWCPKGRLAEDGAIPKKYTLREMETTDYSQRTLRNVEDSDGTLILYEGRLSGGTLVTWRYCLQLKKPVLRISVKHLLQASLVQEWIREHQIQKLNVAGPRASKNPEIYAQTFRYLLSVFSMHATEKKGTSTLGVSKRNRS